MEPFQILLATNRPAVETFFVQLQRCTARPVAVGAIPLAAEALARRPAPTATVAAVDVAPDPVIAIRVCRELRQRRPGLPILGLLCCPQATTPWQVQALLAAGVGGLLDLHAPADEVLRILHRVARGEVVLQVRLAGDVRGDEAERRAALSAHLLNESSSKLLGLLAQGLSDGEIGQRLYMSPHTVKHAIERLREDVGARNRIALAAWAGRYGFDRPAPDTEASPE